MRVKKSVSIRRFDETNSEKFPHMLSCYNYYASGKLYNSRGVRVARFPKTTTDLSELELNIQGAGIAKVDGLTYFKQYVASSNVSTHRLLVHSTDGRLFINQMFYGVDGLVHLYNLRFENPPITLSFKQDDLDAIILTDKKEMFVWATGYSPYKISGVPVITSMCMNEGVLFCTLKDPAFKIWYATDLNAENVGNIDKNSGYISLEDDLGYARKILTFNENVYVFRDYGITKVSFYKNTVSTTEIYQSNTMIFSNSVSVCGNKILFATRDGLYSFNGGSVSKVKIDMLDNIDFVNSKLACASLGDEYYMSAKMNFLDGEKVLCENGEYTNNALIIIDINNLSCEVIRGVDIGSMLPLKTEVFEKMLVTFNSMHDNTIGEIVDLSVCCDEVLPKCWLSGDLVEDRNVKLFNKLTVESKKGVDFTIIYDDKELTFTTYCDGVNEFRFQAIGKKVSLKIYSVEPDAMVDTVVLDYYDY